MAAKAESSDEEDDMLRNSMIVQMNMNMSYFINKKRKAKKIDHRTLPRSGRTYYDHAGAVACMMRDYLGPVPLFADRQFDVMFRLSRSRFQRLLEDVGNSGNSFFLAKKDLAKRPVASLEARLLLPLKTLAYGVASHAFRDYFQMSETLARDCCLEFDKAIKSLCQAECLRLPTAEDLKGIEKLHKSQHRVNGMYGSLDCMHTHWKNCPKAWQGQFQGKEKKQTIVLEAICDYHMWFWHASYGYAGTLNDLNVLNLSPFLDALVDGRFAELERVSGVVPYQILEGQEFNEMFILVDGIYHQFSRFVKAHREPISRDEKTFTGWQELAREDIERAFGVLQLKF
jgi:hypothetical protein